MLTPREATKKAMQKGILKNTSNSKEGMKNREKKERINRKQQIKQ